MMAGTDTIRIAVMGAGGAPAPWGRTPSGLTVEPGVASTVGCGKRRATTLQGRLGIETFSQEVKGLEWPRRSVIAPAARRQRVGRSSVTSPYVLFAYRAVSQSAGLGPVR
jgi:hypothetical protein